MASAWASWLAQQGIRAGDRCAILAANDAHWCAAYLGILKRGAVAVPLDTNYSSAQVATIVRDSGAKLLFVSEKFERLASEAGVPLENLHREPNRTKPLEPLEPLEPLGTVEFRASSDSLHKRNDLRPERRGVDPRQSAGGTRRRLRGGERHRPGRAAGRPAAFSFSGAAGELAAAVRGRRARRVSRDAQLHRSGEGAIRTEDHDLCVRAAVLLPDSSTGDAAGREIESHYARPLQGVAGPELSIAPARRESRPRVLRQGPRRAGPRRAALRYGRIEVRSGRRQRPLFAWVHDPAGLRPDRDERARVDQHAGRSAHRHRRPRRFLVSTSRSSTARSLYEGRS